MFPKFDLSTAEGAKALEDYANKLFRVVLESHPKYPEYGYVFENGKFVEKKLKSDEKESLNQVYMTN